ncbi:putative GPI anchored protein [Pholiota molesta]|nr:putative GPI anchored protein [Pholiota molesta]
MRTSRIVVNIASLIFAGIIRGADASLVQPPCRFASNYTTSSILANPDAFEQDVLYWEGMFHQNNVSYNALNGMTFDGTLIDPVTGIHNIDGLHTFSAASKESLHMMTLAHVIQGTPGAVRWILAAQGGGADVEAARKIAISILQKKWNTYSTFNQTYPGFGGFLPWFAHSGPTPLAPTWDWVNRVPALDNGENIWAIYAVIQALQSTGRSDYRYLPAIGKTTMQTIFYRGNGLICAVTDIANQSLPVNHPSQSYVCEGSSYIDDPYEGEAFMYFLYLFGNLNATEKEALLAFKRPQLVSVDWNSPGYESVNVQKGFWFSAHENWVWMQLPYTDVPLLDELERATPGRHNPGMYASINNSTDSTGQIMDVCCQHLKHWHPPIANQTTKNLMLELTTEILVITPYSTMNTMVVNKTVGLAWWHNMAVAKRMQNLYGSSESTRVDGTATSAFVSWDSKVTTINGLLGGVTSLVRAKMQSDGVYDTFIHVVASEHESVFGKAPLKGLDAPFCLPQASVPDTGLEDFTTCSN